MTSAILSRRRIRILTRNLSTRAPSPEILNSVYISRATSPLFNLSFEDWLFRHAPPQKPLLFLYRNAPCVVIGRNQNPWLEVNMPALQARGIPFIRRRSGGGTVYHDLGNTNFSIHLPRSTFDRHATARLVLRAVRALGIPDARVNERNDICVGEDKISSAYKIVTARAYHHGTMLISTQLDTLGDLLRVDKSTLNKIMSSTGVASVRSPVCNLRQRLPSADHAGFARAMEEAFRDEYAIDPVDDPTQHVDESSGNQEYIQAGMAELETWPWKYGQTPLFELAVSERFAFGQVEVRLKSKHGVITDSSISVRTEGVSSSGEEKVKEQLEAFLRGSQGEAYGRWPPEENSNTGEDVAGSGGAAVRAVGEWLRTVLR